MRSRLDIIKTALREALETPQEDLPPLEANPIKGKLYRGSDPKIVDLHVDYLRQQISHHTSQLQGWGMASGDTSRLTSGSYQNFHAEKLRELQAKLHHITSNL
jgi:hypothetical protein